MVPRHHRGWWQRLGAVVKPERVGTVLLLLLSWGESRHHSDTLDADAGDSRRALWRHTFEVERRADSLSVRTNYLERQVKRLGRAARGLPGANTAPYGPAYGDSMPRAPTLSGFIAHILSIPFGWMRTR